MSEVWIGVQISLAAFGLGVMVASSALLIGNAVSSSCLEIKVPVYLKIFALWVIGATFVTASIVGKFIF